MRSTHGGNVAGVSAFEERARQHSARGDYRKAGALLRQGLRLLGPARTRPSRDHLSLWNELGMVYKYSGKFEKAEQCYRLALRHARRCLEGREHDSFLATLYHNLGGLEHSRRRYQRGERYARKSVELRCKGSGARGLDAASDMAALAALLDGLGKFEESETLYGKALKIYRREYGPSHREIAVVLNNLAAVYQATGRPTEAEAQYRAALEMKRRELGKSHPDVGVTLNNLGMLYRSQHKASAARKCFQRAVRILNESLGSSHPNTRAVRGNLTRLGSNESGGGKNG